MWKTLYAIGLALPRIILRPFREFELIIPEIGAPSVAQEATKEFVTKIPRGDFMAGEMPRGDFATGEMPRDTAMPIPGADIATAMSQEARPETDEMTKREDKLSMARREILHELLKLLKDYEAQLIELQAKRGTACNATFDTAIKGLLYALISSSTIETQKGFLKWLKTFAHNTQIDLKQLYGVIGVEQVSEKGVKGGPKSE